MGLRECPLCGKQFFVGLHGWGYAYNGRYTCSYACMRGMGRIDEMTKQEKEQIDQLMAQGLASIKIAEMVGVKPQAVYDYKQSLKKQQAKAAGTVPPEKPELKPEPEPKPEPLSPIKPVLHETEIPKQQDDTFKAPLNLVTPFDRKRIILTLCDIAEQLIVILREGVT